MQSQVQERGWLEVWSKMLSDVSSQEVETLLHE